MLLFLDLDGVLRRATAPPGVLDADCVARLQCLLEELPSLRIVISSDWRLDRSVDELRDLLPPGIAAHVVGVTPVSEQRGPSRRYREVVEYFQDADGDTADGWVAVDDDPYNYPRASVGVSVVLTDPFAGLDDASIAAIRQLLQPPAEPAERQRRFLIENGVAQ